MLVVGTSMYCMLAHIPTHKQRPEIQRFLVDLAMGRSPKV